MVVLVELVARNTDRETQPLSDMHSHGVTRPKLGQRFAPHGRKRNGLVVDAVVEGEPLTLLGKVENVDENFEVEMVLEELVQHSVGDLMGLLVGVVRLAPQELANSWPFPYGILHHKHPEHQHPSPRRTSPQEALATRQRRHCGNRLLADPVLQIAEVSSNHEFGKEIGKNSPEDFA